MTKKAYDLSLPSDKNSWRHAKKTLLVEGKTPPELPVDLRRMSERQRIQLYNYLGSLSLQELKRRHDVIHSQQSEAHQHLRYYGKNSSYDRTVANLEVLDKMYQSLIEVKTEEYEEMLSSKYGMENEKAFSYPSWVLPNPDKKPIDLKTDYEGVVVAGTAIGGNYGD